MTERGTAADRDVRMELLYSNGSVRRSTTRQAASMVRLNLIDVRWQTFGGEQLQIITTYNNDRLPVVVPPRGFHGTVGSTANHRTPSCGGLTASRTTIKQSSLALLPGKSAVSDERMCMLADVNTEKSA